MLDNFKNELVKAKALGSAKTGSYSWLQQRITGGILAICSIWLICFIVANHNQSVTFILQSLKQPYNAVALLIFVTTSFYHAMLGMRVIIEDYISCTKLRISLIILVQMFCIVTIITFILALFYKV